MFTAHQKSRLWHNLLTPTHIISTEQNRKKKNNSWERGNQLLITGTEEEEDEDEDDDEDGEDSDSLKIDSNREIKRVTPMWNPCWRLWPGRQTDGWTRTLAKTGSVRRVRNLKTGESKVTNCISEHTTVPNLTMNRCPSLNPYHPLAEVTWTYLMQSPVGSNTLWVQNCNWHTCRQHQYINH